MHKSVVLIPTYNESDSILHLINDLRKIDIDIIVIDDDSPDQTSQLVKNLHYAHVRVINNGAKNGIGMAYISGFKLALQGDYEFIATMDADGSHSVHDLQKMLAQGPMCDVVMGVRWIKGGSVTNWSLHRKLLSQFGTWYARKALKMKYRDLTGGLRVYRANALQRLNLDVIGSNGYCFQIEMIRAFSQLNAHMSEIPITFVERELGKSKMSKSIVFEAFYLVSLWGIQRILKVNADKLHYVK